MSIDKLATDIMQIMKDPTLRAQFLADQKARQAARVAAMSPEERARYEAEKQREEEHNRWLSEPVPMTRGELEMRDQHFDMVLEEKVAEAEDRTTEEVLAEVKPHFDKVRGERDAAQADAERTHKNLAGALNALVHASVKAAHATSSQGGTDSKLTEALKEIGELKATVAKLTRERDAVRLAYLELLDRQAKRGK